MEEIRLVDIQEYIFSPFSTFIYLNRDEIRFRGIDNIREIIIKKLNENPISFEKFKMKVIWCVEESEEFKLSKGVFAPPGKGNSFVMAKLVNDDPKIKGCIIEEEIGKPTFSLEVAIVTVTLLGLIGFVSGFAPARRASNLDPVEALRS